MKLTKALVRGAAALIITWAAYAKTVEASGCQEASWCDWTAGGVDECEFLEPDELEENKHCDMEVTGECEDGFGLQCTHPN